MKGSTSIAIYPDIPKASSIIPSQFTWGLLCVWHSPSHCIPDACRYLEKEDGLHGHQWDAWAVVWCNGSGIDDVHNQQYNGRYGLIWQSEVGKGKLVVNYSGTWVYRSLHGRQHDHKIFVGGRRRRVWSNFKPFLCISLREPNTFIGILIMHGLGLKYCIQSVAPTTSCISKEMHSKVGTEANSRTSTL